MPSFSYMRESAVSEETTVDYQLVHLRGRPVLVVAPGTAENRDLLNEELAEPARPDVKKTPHEIAESLRGARVNRAARFSRHVVKGWRGVVDDTGAEVPFSIDNCREFLTSLATEASWIFDDLAAFVRDPSHFVGAFNSDGAAKNSVRG